jgi:hypothetical protein
MPLPRQPLRCSSVLAHPDREIGDARCGGLSTLHTQQMPPRASQAARPALFWFILMELRSRHPSNTITRDLHPTVQTRNKRYSSTLYGGILSMRPVIHTVIRTHT